MSNISRRQFVKRSAALGAASTVGFPSLIRALGLNEKLQVGFIAVGGRAGGHTSASHKAGLQCIAFAEVDIFMIRHGRYKFVYYPKYAP